MKTKPALLLTVAVLGLAAASATNTRADGFSFGITIGHSYPPPVYIPPPVVYAPPVYPVPAPAPCPPAVPWVAPVCAPRVVACPPSYVVYGSYHWPKHRHGHGHGHGYGHGRGYGRRH